MADEGSFSIHLEHVDDYEFKVRFDWEGCDGLRMDEPAPLGGERGPNAGRLVAAAAANCLSASLLYCLSKADVAPASVRTSATGNLVRNEHGRLRIGALQVRITLSGTLAASAKLERCLDLFEDFCIVTSSLREGIPVQVQVVDAGGAVLRGPG